MEFHAHILGFDVSWKQGFLIVLGPVKVCALGRTQFQVGRHQIGIGKLGL